MHGQHLFADRMVCMHANTDGRLNRHERASVYIQLEGILVVIHRPIRMVKVDVRHAVFSACGCFDLFIYPFYSAAFMSLNHFQVSLSPGGQCSRDHAHAACCAAITAAKLRVHMVSLPLICQSYACISSHKHLELSIHVCMLTRWYTSYSTASRYLRTIDDGK